MFSSRSIELTAYATVFPSGERRGSDAHTTS
jgi:hypothetical protein